MEGDTSPSGSTSDQGPCSRYSEEARLAAAALVGFSQRYTAKGLADIALDSASLVEQCISMMDENCRTVVSLLQKENSSLRAEIESLVQHSAEAVASALAPTSLVAKDDDELPSWQPQAHLFAGHDQAIQLLSDTVKQLTEENDQLRDQVMAFQLTYVPKSVADSFRSQLDTLERDLQSKKSELEAALVKLEHSVTLHAAPSATTTNAHDDEDSVSAARLKTNAAYSVYDSAMCDPMWADAIRELEERAIVAASQVRDRDYVDQLERNTGNLEATCAGLKDELEHAQKLLETVEQDHSVLKVQNEALMGQFVSLLQTTQQLATQYQLLTDRTSSARGSQEMPVSPSASFLTKTVDMDKKVMQSLLDVQQYHHVLENSVVAPQTSVLSVGELSKLGASRSYFAGGASPAPRQPYHTSSTYRRFTKEDIASSAEKYSVQSIGDLVRKNQKLLGQTTEMELDNAHLRAENVKLELRVATLALQVTETSSSDATSRLSGKRSRVEAEAQQKPHHVDSATSTDSTSELLFWQTCPQQGAALELVPHTATSTPPPSSNASAETLYWTLLRMLGEVHASLMAALGEQLDVLGGEHARGASDALLRSTVAYAARTLRAEHEALVANSAYAEALEDLHVRDALVPQHLEAIRQLAEHALVRKSHNDRTQREDSSVDVVGLPHNAKDISLWNSFTQLLQSATTKEQMFTLLIQEAPTRSELSQTLISVSDTKLKDAESSLAEMTTQLEQERSRTAVLADALHREKLRHVETLERMWAAEQKVVEAEDSLKVMRLSSDCMFTRDQYEAVRTELAQSQSAAVQAQIALDEQRDDAERKLQELGNSLSSAHQELEEKYRLVSNLQSQISNAQAVNASLNQQLFNAQRESQSLRAEAKAAADYSYEVQRELGVSQRMVEELKQAVLSQQCTETLLLTLFPGDESLEAVFARSRDLNMENRQLKEALAARDLQLATVENQIATARAELCVAEDCRQQAVVDLQLQRTSASAEEHNAAREAKRLGLELEGLHHRLASLQREKDQLQQREKVLEAQIEVLAADPISMNVRKYGVERTKTIELQMEEMHQRCLQLQSAAATLEAQRGDLEATVAALSSELATGTKRCADLEGLVSELRDTNQAHVASIHTLTQSETSLSQRVQELTVKVADTARSLDAETLKLVAAMEWCQKSNEAERLTKEANADVMNHNMMLIEQVNTLKECVTRIEAEHRITKSALATQTAAMAARAASAAPTSSSNRKFASSFAEASSWRK